jgi:hypothetical protein
MSSRNRPCLTIRTELDLARAVLARQQDQADQGALEMLQREQTRRERIEQQRLSQR